MKEINNIQKAMDYLICRSAPKYDEDCGKCAKMVRQAVEFGFDPKTLERKQSAKDYGCSYEKIGFKKIFSFPKQEKSEYKRRTGDISIIKYDPHGHIAMLCKGIDPKTGKSFRNWISDFKQWDMYGGGVRKKNPPFDIYRYDS